MKNSILYSLLLTVFTAFGILSCTDKIDDPPNVNEEELITTVELSFINDSNANDMRLFLFSDPDGFGGNEPITYDTVILDTNSSYALQVRFLDESGSSTKDITEEIKQEANDHLICYSTKGSLNILVLDTDGKMLPLGLESKVKTGTAETTDLTISLKHQPDIKTGDCQLGETDVEVLFRVEVK